MREAAKNPLSLGAAGHAPPRCPRDGLPLALHTHGEASLHACDACHGFWISGAQREQWMQLHPAAPLAATRRGPKPGQRRKFAAIHCPACACTRLLIRKVEDVEIDVCPQCRGLWLDAGELERVIAWHRRRRGKYVLPGSPQLLAGEEPAGGPASSRTGWLDAVDVAGHVAGEAAAAVLEFLFEAIGSAF
jgi:Zn-finger nucleic acid-binding protein